MMYEIERERRKAFVLGVTEADLGRNTPKTGNELEFCNGCGEKYRGHELDENGNCPDCIENLKLWQEVFA